ncbi:MAG: NADPH:quinone oxidoreductase family protein [Alphaproteobacteria bacterium]
MSALMRAWQSPEQTGIDALSLIETDVPVPADNEVLVRVEAAALNFSDLLMIDGMYQIRPDRPFTPGQEIAGTVVAVGSDAGLSEGTRVAGKVLWGGFAEYAVMRADMAIPLPDGIGAATGVALPVVYTTAMVALLEDAGMQAGDTVLIHAAAGGVGLAAVQIAKAHGAKVFAVAGGPEKCALVSEHGADVAIDYKSQDFAEIVMEQTGGDGADIILDSVGGDTTKNSLRCIAWQGQLLIVGFSSGEIPRIAANRLLLRRAVARGIYWDHDRDGEMVARCTDALVDMCVDGLIAPVVNTDYGLEDLPRALGDMRAGGTVGKIVLTVSHGDVP